MLRTFALLIFEVFYILGTLFKMPHLRRLRKSNDTAGIIRLSEDVVYHWSVATLHQIGAEITVDGKENLPPTDIPAVFVANHQSYLDIPLVSANIGKPRPFISKVEIKKIPIVRTWMEAWGCVFVDRENARSAASAFHDGAKIVTDGGSIFIFPEGTRSRDGKVHEFKTGSFRIAQLAKAPIIPCCIDGTGSVLEGNGMRVNPKAHIRLRILPMIDTSAYTRDDWKALPALCYEKITQGLADMRDTEKMSEN